MINNTDLEAFEYYNQEEKTDMKVVNTNHNEFGMYQTVERIDGKRLIAAHSGVVTFVADGTVYVTTINESGTDSTVAVPADELVVV